MIATLTMCYFFDVFAYSLSFWAEASVGNSLVFHCSEQGQ